MTDRGGPASNPIRLGVVARSSQTTWPALRDVALRAERLGYHSLWTNDHVLAIAAGRAEDPIFEGWMTLAAWAAATRRVRLGLLVSCNTFREPALVAKMATTLDHISGGRAILGIGAGWFEAEHTAYGIPFASSARERLSWLAEALPIIRGMLDDGEASAVGTRYRVRQARNSPRPVQGRLPVLVGGDGEKITLRLVAQHADACNLSSANGVDGLRRKLTVLRQHCRELGRDESDIDLTVEISVVMIRDSRQAAIEAYRAVGGPLWMGERPGLSVGTVDDTVTLLQALVELGFRHVLCGFPSPYDDETVERLITEALPRLRTGADVRLPVTPA